MIGQARLYRSLAYLARWEHCVWARYLKVEHLTQYGNEFYCPVTLLRLHQATMMEELKHLGEIISVGGAEEYIIEQVAPEAVAINVKKQVQAGVTAITLTVEEAMPKEVHAVHEVLVQEIRIQRYYDGMAISGPVLMLGVEPLFLQTCEVMSMLPATPPTPTSSMTESSTVILA